MHQQHLPGIPNPSEAERLRREFNRVPWQRGSVRFEEIIENPAIKRCLEIMAETRRRRRRRRRMS